MPTFNDMYPTYELSIERFDATVSRDELDDHYRLQAAKIKDTLLERTDALVSMLSLDNSPIEQLMATFGFVKQATEIKQRRLDDVATMAKNHGIVIERETKYMGPGDTRP